MKFVNYMKHKSIRVSDLITVSIIAITFLFAYINSADYKVFPSTKVSLLSPWIAHSDEKGFTYVVDSNRARLITMKNNVIMDINTQFGYIDDMIVGKDNLLYVIDTSWHPDSFKVDSDTIYSYNTDTGEVVSLYKSEYKTATKHQMFGLKLINNNLHVATADNNGINHLTLDLKGNVKDYFYYTYHDAVTMLQDIAVSNDGSSLYAIDKRGSIVKFSKDKNDNPTIKYIYEWDNLYDDNQAEPYRLDVDNDSNVYITDIVKNNLFKIKFNKDFEDEPKVTQIGDEHENLLNVKVDTINNKTYINATESDTFKTYNESGKIINTGEKIKYNTKYLSMIIINIVANIFASLSLLFVLLRLAFIFFATKPTSAQLLSRVVMGSIIIVSAVILLQLLSSFYNMLRKEKLNKLELLANNVTRHLDTESLEKIKKPSDFMNDDFKNVHASMSDSLDYNYDSSMYANVVRWDKDSDTVYDVAFYDNSIGAYYPLFGSEAEEVKEVYETKKAVTSSTSTENGGFIYVKLPITKSDGTVIGVIEIGTWSDVVRGQITKVINNLTLQLAIWLILILFVFNEVFAVLKIKEKEELAVKEGKISSKDLPLFVNRAMIFMIFFAYNLPTAFLPVYVSKMYKGGLPFATSFAKSMPISINMLLIGLAALVGFKLMSTLKFSKALFIGAVVTLTGDFLLAIAPNYSFIITGLILNGIGVGLQMNFIHSVNSFIATKRKDNTIFTIYQSGSLSGIMVGMAFGAILADIIGYKNVFFATVLVWAAISLLSVVVGKKYRFTTSSSEESTVKSDVSGNDKDNNKNSNNNENMTILSFLFSGNVLSFLLLIVFSYVILTSFVYYYVPIFCDNLGYSSNTTCLFIMINSICGIYLSAPTTKLFTKKFGSKSIYISSFISLGALIIFALLPDLNILLFALLVLGFSTSFGMAVRITAFSNLPQTRGFGLDRATGMYDLMERSGEAIGPIIFAALLEGNFLTGILIFSSISVFAMILYVFIAKYSKIKTIKKSKKGLSTKT